MSTTLTDNSERHIDGAGFLGLHPDSEIFAMGGDDQVYGMRGRDIIWGGQGDDMLDGGSGDDRLMGEWANDTLYGARARSWLNASLLGLGGWCGFCGRVALASGVGIAGATASSSRALAILATRLPLANKP